MHWDKASRFKTPEGRVMSPDSTYPNFSEYLRKQFLQSKHLFAATNSPSKSKKPSSSPGKQSYLDSTQNDFDSPISSPTKYKHGSGLINSSSSPTLDRTSSAPSSPSPASPTKRVPLMKQKPKIIPITCESIPGPGSYHIERSLIKPSFNRVYSEPPSPIVTNNNNNNTNSNSFKDSISPTLWNSHKGAYFNKISFKMKSTSTPENPFPSNHFNQAAYGNSYGSPSKKINKEDNLFGNRYPLPSDKTVRRWKSISQDSYINHASRSPASTKLMASTVKL